jgi:hypothetical protein
MVASVDNNPTQDQIDHLLEANLSRRRWSMMIHAVSILSRLRGEASGGPEGKTSSGAKPVALGGPGSEFWNRRSALEGTSMLKAQTEMDSRWPSPACPRLFLTRGTELEVAVVLGTIAPLEEEPA